MFLGSCTRWIAFAGDPYAAHPDRRGDAGWGSVGMERRTRAHEDVQVQEYCSECGQPIPPAEPDDETQSLQWQASETESQAAVEQPPESSQKDARASAPPRPAAGGAAIRPTGRRTRSGPRLDAPPSGKSTPPRQPPTKPWYRKPRLVVPLIILAVIVAVAAVGFGALLAG